ncbi:MAG: hypothetical protein R3Y49_07880 [Rikenellaceae bacterium]
MKAILQIILAGAVIALGYWIFTIFKTPIDFNSARTAREEVVVERLKDIRTVQRAFRNANGKFAGSFQELFDFYHTDSMKVILAIGSEDDSSAMGQLVRVESFLKMSDTIFNHRGKDFVIEEIQYIPFSELATGSKVRFAMDTATIVTESAIAIPVFEAFAKYPLFLGDLDKQELINYRDEKVNTLRRADGLKVGSTTESTNEAGNWE